jgi:hypothetical protein
MNWASDVALTRQGVFPCLAPNVNPYILMSRRLDLNNKEKKGPPFRLVRITKYIYWVPQCLSPSQNWDFPTLPPTRECTPSMKQRGHKLACGWRSTNADDCTTGEKPRTVHYVNRIRNLIISSAEPKSIRILDYYATYEILMFSNRWLTAITSEVKSTLNRIAFIIVEVKRNKWLTAITSEVKSTLNRITFIPFIQV